MRTVLSKIRPAMHLARVSSAFGAIANVWFVILWSRAEPTSVAERGPLSTLPLAALLAAGAVYAIGLYAFGAVLNDMLDRRRDRALRPGRPIPAGQVSPELSAILVAGSLLITIAGAATFGGAAALVAVAVASGILLFHLVGKFIPGIGFVLLIAVYAGHMLAPNPDLRFLLPVWLVMTHSLVATWAQHVLARRTPAISVRAGLAAIAGWSGLSLLILHRHLTNASSDEPAPDPFPALQITIIAVLAVGCVAWCAYRVARTGPGARAADKVGKYAGLWLPAYGCAWLFTAQHWNEGWILAAMTFGGVIGLSLLRDAYNLIENPAKWRRE